MNASPTRCRCKIWSAQWDIDQATIANKVMYVSQNLHCSFTCSCVHWLARGPTCGCQEVQRYARIIASARRYKVRKSEWKCPRLFSYRDINRAFNRAHFDPSFLRLKSKVETTGP